jgi:predicted nucleic acid-binding protein
MDVLVDSSIWIGYFRSGANAQAVEFLIDENLVATNDLILTELIPFLKIKNQQKLIKLLQRLTRHPLNIDWEDVIKIQTKCLSKGITGIGIPDLLITQNCLQNKITLYSADKHFIQLQKITKLNLYTSAFGMGDF